METMVKVVAIFVVVTIVLETQLQIHQSESVNKNKTNNNDDDDDDDNDDDKHTRANKYEQGTANEVCTKYDEKKNSCITIIEMKYPERIHCIATTIQYYSIIFLEKM
jgi:hypothetical protein